MLYREPKLCLYAHFGVDADEHLHLFADPGPGLDEVQQPVVARDDDLRTPSFMICSYSAIVSVMLV